METVMKKSIIEGNFSDTYSVTNQQCILKGMVFMLKKARTFRCRKNVLAQVLESAKCIFQIDIQYFFRYIILGPEC